MCAGGETMELTLWHTNYIVTSDANAIVTSFRKLAVFVFQHTVIVEWENA